MKVLTLKSLKKEIDELKTKIIKEKATVILNKEREKKAIEELKSLGWKEIVDFSTYNATFITLEKEF